MDALDAIPPRLTVLVIHKISVGRMEVGAIVFGPNQEHAPGSIMLSRNALTFYVVGTDREAWIHMLKNPNPNQ